jgi:uncharacterized protein (TIGR03067 family)
MSGENPFIGLDGRWRILAVEDDGVRDESVPSDELFATIQGDEFIVESPGLPSTRTPFRCDLSRHRFDFLSSRGTVRAPGIYCLDGPRLVICANLGAQWPARPWAPPSQAPTSFSTFARSGWRLWIMERVTSQSTNDNRKPLS